MKLKFFLPLVIVLLGFYAAETESFGFGIGLAARLAIRFVQRLIRLAAELARRGRPASYQQLGSSTRALVRYAPPGARQVIKKSLAKVKKVVLSPKFQAGVLAAEGVGAIVDAAIAVNPPISYENFTDAELDSEWQSLFPTTNEEILELYENQNETEFAFSYQPDAAETQLLIKLDAVANILFEKLTRLEEEIDEAKKNEFDEPEPIKITSGACTLCNAAYVIIAIKLLVILLV